MAPSMTRVRAAASILKVMSERFASGGSAWRPKPATSAGSASFTSRMPIAAVALFDEEFDVEAFAFENLDEFEAAGHAVERHHALGGVFRVVLVDVGVHLSAIAAVEGGEPGLEGLACWSGGDRRLGKCGGDG